MAKALEPINIIPFHIYNRPAFLEQNHPIINPRDPEYSKYWWEVTEKCIYGKWGYDYDDELKLGGWRWQPGNLYFYIEFTPIEVQGEDNSTDQETPTLRSIDWLKFYGMVTCDGFSGMSDDEEITCYRPIQKLEQGLTLKHAERIQLELESEYVKKKDGTYKKYMDAREYLYMVHDKPKGRPNWRNEAQNWLELTTRGLGKSYTIANAEIAYTFCFNGCRTIEDLKEGKKNATITVGSSLSEYTDDLLKKFSDTYEWLRTHYGYYHDGIRETYGWFWHPTEGQLTISGKVFTNKVEKKGGQGKLGAGSKIYNITYYKKDNAAIGKRGKYIVDEAGTLENFKKVHGFNNAAQNRESKFTKSVYSGTGGSMTQIIGIKDAFTNPAAYDVLPYEDLFGYNNLYTGLFVPVYYRKKIYLDKNGNLKLQQAFEDELADRKKKAKDSTQAYDEHVISYPFWPHEMFMQAKENLFPTVLLEERLSELESGEWTKIAKPGWLEYTDNDKTKVEFKLDLQGKLEILNRYESEKKAKSKKGGIVIYEMPMADKPISTYKNPLYLTVYDPVLKDLDGTSVCAVIVFKFFYPKDMDTIQFNIVAEWYGRNDTLDENHEVAWKLACFYGSKLLPEINNADILRNGKDTYRWGTFQPKPKGALGEFNQTKEYEVGVLITAGMKGSLALYLNEMFNTIIDKKVTIEDGVVIEKNIKMASQIPSIRVIDEALQYGDGNFDAISAMFLVSLIHRDSVLIPHSTNKPSEETLRSYKRFVQKKTYKVLRHPAYSK